MEYSVFPGECSTSGKKYLCVRAFTLSFQYGSMNSV